MFRALFWKEWRQLAMVRWGGIAIGAILPLAFLAGAEMAKRGILQAAGLYRYSSADILFVVLPVTLALGLWPLIALMAAVQSFAGDRAAGTESFLLERPVPRARVWLARLAAGLAALAVVIAVTAGVGTALAALVGAPASGWETWKGSLIGAAVLAPLAFLGGMVASALLAVTLGAVLAGAVLAALPVLFGAELASLFPHARLGAVPIGFVLPVLMLPAYVAASWAASCRGEPAGRGRIVRALSIAAGSIPAVMILFVVAAPLAVRASAKAGTYEISPSPSGATALVLTGRERWGDGAWLTDVATGRTPAFLPPRLQSVTWSPDGSRFALGTWSSALGGESKAMRLEIRDGRDGHLLRSIPAGERDLIWGIVWTRDGIVAAWPLHRNATVSIVDPETGTWRETGFVHEGWASLVAPRRDGRVLLRSPVHDTGAVRNKMRGYQLRPIDAASSRVGDPLTDAQGQPLCFAGWLAGLSPGGTLVILAPAEPGGTARVASFPAGSAVMALPSAATARWLDGDRLAWTADLEGKTRLFMATPGGAPAAVREWTGAHLQIDPSPDGKTLLVTVFRGAAPSDRPSDPRLFDTSAPSGTVPETGIFSIDDGRWRSLAVPVPDDAHAVRWAGPKTLAFMASGAVAFEDLDHPGVRRFVLGGEGDLR